MAVFQGACNFDNDLVCFWAFKMIFLAFKMLISYKRNTITTTLSSFLYTNHQYKYISPKRRYFFSDIYLWCLRYLISVCA